MVWDGLELDWEYVDGMSTSAIKARENSFPAFILRSGVSGIVRTLFKLPGENYSATSSFAIGNQISVFGKFFRSKFPKFRFLGTYFEVNFLDFDFWELILKQSTSVIMEPSTRTRYPRQCNLTLEVKEISTSTGCSNRIPRKLTERRKNLIREFLHSFLERPHMYAAYGTEPWIDSLLEYMNERTSYGLAPIDVKIWMGNEKFFRDEVISMFSRRRAPNVEDESASDVPAVQPHPSHIIPEILPNDPHPHNFRVKAEPEELEYRVYTEIAPEEAAPLTGDPLEMMPEEEPMEGLEYDFVAPLPPPRRGSYSNTFGYVRQLLDSCTRTCEILDDLKRCNHPGMNMDVFYHCAHLMKHLAKETYDEQVNSLTPQSVGVFN
ncbi:unnamed protein product [Orchesella dallaii]|uniref:Uncharacterized protein n=1 Tax=Orchesella dallaii TaxID=48710 RepID=A0ABP1S810_9HEXA